MVGTKTLNQAVTTLKRNPARVSRLVKAAKFRIVPAHHLASGKEREALEQAIKKLKAKRGLNGVVGESAGPFSDKALSKQAETSDKVLAGTAVVSGGALGAGLAQDHAKKRILHRTGTKGAYAHMSDPSIENANKRILRNVKVLNRMGKSVRRATVRGGLAGAAVGTALGVAHMKKEAAVPALPPKQEFLGKGPIPLNAKDVSKKHILKGKAVKAGKVAAGIAAVGSLAYAAKNRMEKKAEDSAIPTLAVLGAGAAGLRRGGKDALTAAKGLLMQGRHITAKGKRITPIDLKMALHSLKKPLRSRALKSAGKGAAAGIVAGATADNIRGIKKQAAEKIVRDGKAYRKGTPGSAAGNMAGINAGLQLGGNIAALSRMKEYGIPAPKGSLLHKVPSAAAGGALMGYVYGKIRGHYRNKRGETSLSHHDFAMKKAS